MRRFAPGRSIVWRSVDRAKGVVQTVWPCTVARDDPGGIVLYMPVGTVGKQRTGTRGGPRDRLMIEWDGGHRDITWHSADVVRLYQEGDAFSIWIAREQTTGAVAWRYINLEDPWERTSIGFDSKDRWLDLWSEPGSDEWQWKDEDELAWLVSEGRVSADWASEVRASGEAAVARIRAGRTLLDPSWYSWRPDPSWGVPSVPRSWRDLEPAR